VCFSYWPMSTCHRDLGDLDYETIGDSMLMVCAPYQHRLGLLSGDTPDARRSGFGGAIYQAAGGATRAGEAAHTGELRAMGLFGAIDDWGTA
jgi:hypothetical protein